MPRLLLRVPPVLHGQAEDPRHRWPCGPLRGPLRQGCRLPRSSEPPRRPDPGCAPFHTGAAGGERFSSRSPFLALPFYPGPPMFEAVEELIGEHADLEKKLADPSVHSDQANARKLNKRYAELTPIVATFRAWKQAAEDIETAKEFAATDPDFAAEAKELDRTARRKSSPRSSACCSFLATPATTRTCSSRSRPARAVTSPPSSRATCCACTCATPSAWAGRPRSSTPPSPNSAATRTYRSPSAPRAATARPSPGQGVWARLKYEGGVHRVQRVPATESQGRIHTSAAGVLVTPEAEEVEVEVNMNDLRIDVYRSSGPTGHPSTPPTRPCTSAPPDR